MTIDPVLVDRVVERARQWSEAARAYPTARSAKLLSQVLDHEGGLGYTVNFVDGVTRPKDHGVAARSLKHLSRRDSAFLPPCLTAPANVGGRIAPLVPSLASSAAHRVFTTLVDDLVLDVTPDKLDPAIAKLRADDSRLGLNLLSEAVPGSREAAHRMEATAILIERDDVDYVSLKVSTVIGPHVSYGHVAAVEEAVKKLLPLYGLIAASSTFISLDMEEYQDLDLIIDVFMRVLDREEFLEYHAGIVLQAYLPDAFGRLNGLIEWAQARRARGGAPIKVRIVKGVNLSMERVDATMHGWELTVQAGKTYTDANYIACLDAALTPERVDAVNIGIAGMNLFTMAYGYELVRERGIAPGADYEMLTEMATPQSHAVRDTVGPLLHYVPVVRPEEYGVVVAYLIRRLEENTVPENFMSNVFDLEEADTFALEEKRFHDAAGLVSGLAYGPRRKQNRFERTVVPDCFENTRDTDPALHANIERAGKIASRVLDSKFGTDVVAENMVNSDAEAREVVQSVTAAAKKWAARIGKERAQVLQSAAQAIEDHRGELIGIAGSEAGKAIDQGDAEVSEATDFALYYADLAEKFDSLEGAAYVPVSTALVTPPWNFPIAISAGGVLAALATGSGVVYRPVELARRTGSFLAKLMWEAGVPHDVLTLVCTDKSSYGRVLIEETDQTILTGSIDMAWMLRSWRPDFHLFAETFGKNAIIVTLNTDIDLTVKDVVYSAFGHVGQRCSAASLVILVGSVGLSKRFRRQLCDAVRSLKLGHPHDLATQMGPMVEPPHGKLLKGLTGLGEGEAWAIKSRKIDDKLWSPGVRAGVMPMSEYHLTEYFGPVLGVVRVDTLGEAIAWQSAVDSGPTAGLHSLDPDEISAWLSQVQADNVYINRGITGVIVRRQPFGGWKRSSVGARMRAGDPSYLVGLGHVEWAGKDLDSAQISDETLCRAQVIAETVNGVDQNRFLAVVEGMDKALAGHFQPADPSALGVKKNVLHCILFPEVVIRQSGTGPGDAMALAAGALTIGVRPRVSMSAALPKQAVDFLGSGGAEVVLESEDNFLAYAVTRANSVDGVRSRLIGADPRALAKAVGGSVDVGVYTEPATDSGRIELLPFVQEQTVSAMNHRFGNPTKLLNTVI